MDREREREQLGSNNDLLLNSLSGMVWEYDSSSRTLKFINDSVEKLLLYTPDECREVNFWQDNLHPTHQSILEPKGGVIGSYDRLVQRRRKDGSYRWLQETVQASKNADKSAHNTVTGISIDSTGVVDERTTRQLEYELVLKSRIETERRFVALSENATGILYQYLIRKDGSASFQYVSPGSHSILGYRPEEIQNDHDLIFARLHPEDSPLMQAAMLESINNMSQFTFEGRFFTRSGHVIWLRASSTPNKLENGDMLWNGMMMDISDLKSAQNEIKQLNADLANRVSTLASVNSELEDLAARLEISYEQALQASSVKSEFVANISHEVRTPISAVLGMSELLAETELTLDQEQSVKIIRESAQSLLEIINDILDFSKIEAGKMDLESIPFNPIEVLEGAVELLGYAAHRRNLELTASVEDRIPSLVVGDPSRIRQILLNLISNAIKFTSAGGVSVRAQLQSQTAEEIVLLIEVEDTGIGLSAESQNNLFKPFVQAKGSTNRKFGGTGLGLSICKRFAELMGGKIGVSSIEGKGATFWFTAKLAIPAPERIVNLDKPPTSKDSVSENNSASKESSISKKDSSAARDSLTADAPVFLASAVQVHTNVPSTVSTFIESASLANDDASNSIEASELRALETCKPILIAEDNPAMQKLTVLQLQKLGIGSFIAKNGKEAVEAAKSNHYSLIFMDCQMPEMDGFQATRAIRNTEMGTNTRIPIVAMTASAIDGDRKRCLAAGMDDYLLKPVSRAQLIETLLKWLPRT